MVQVAVVAVAVAVVALRWCQQQIASACASRCRVQCPSASAMGEVTTALQALQTGQSHYSPARLARPWARAVRTPARTHTNAARRSARASLPPPPPPGLQWRSLARVWPCSDRAEPGMGCEPVVAASARAARTSSAVSAAACSRQLQPRRQGGPLMPDQAGDPSAVMIAASLCNVMLHRTTQPLCWPGNGPCL